VKDPSQTAILPYRLIASLAMVLLAVIWAMGWFAGRDRFAESVSPLVLVSLTASVFLAWSLVAAVIAAGFFHAASIHSATTYRGYRAASLTLVIIGILLLFPVPLMATVLGHSPVGRALALLVTCVSIAAIIFGRARLGMIHDRLTRLYEGSNVSLAPIEEIDQIGETGP
jgi:hypothetical protein